MIKTQRERERGKKRATDNNAVSMIDYDDWISTHTQAEGKNEREPHVRFWCGVQAIVCIAAVPRLYDINNSDQMMINIVYLLY